METINRIAETCDEVQAAADDKNASQTLDQALEAEAFVLMVDIPKFVPIHVQHARKLARRGEFPQPLRVGGRSVVRKRDLLAWLRSHT